MANFSDCTSLVSAMSSVASHQWRHYPRTRERCRNQLCGISESWFLHMSTKVGIRFGESVANKYEPKHGCGLQAESAMMSAPVLGISLFVCLTIGMTAEIGAAESVVPAATPTTAPAKTVTPAAVPSRSAPYPTLHPFPVMDPKKIVTGVALKAALRRGGLVLYLRHTENGLITQQCDTSNLTPRGEADAVRIGQAIRELKLPIGKIFSSDICRVRDTARLVDLGAVEITEDLTNMPKRDGQDIHAARMKLLATPPPAGNHHLLVSHIHGGEREEQAIYLDLGEIIVYRPNGKGGSDAIARIRMEDWPNLAAGGNVALQQVVR